MSKKRKYDQPLTSPPNKRPCQLKIHNLISLEKKLSFSGENVTLENHRGLNSILSDVTGTNDMLPVIQLISKRKGPILILTSEKRKMSWYLRCRLRLESESSFLAIPYWGSSRDRAEMRSRFLQTNNAFVPIFVCSFEIWTRDDHLLSVDTEWNTVVFDMIEQNISNIMRNFFSGRIVFPLQRAVLITNVSPDQMSFEMIWSMVRFSIPFWSANSSSSSSKEEVDVETREILLRNDSRDVMSIWKNHNDDNGRESLKMKWRHILSHLIVTRSRRVMCDVKHFEVSFDLSGTQRILLQRLQNDISEPIHQLLRTWRKVCMMNGSFDEMEDIIQEEPILNLGSMQKIREILDVVRKVNTHPDLYMNENVKMPLYAIDMDLLQSYWFEEEVEEGNIVPVRRSVFGRYVIPDRVYVTDHHYSTPSENLARRLVLMYPINIFVKSKLLELVLSSCCCFVDPPKSLELLRSIFMERIVAPSRELITSSLRRQKSVFDFSLLKVDGNIPLGGGIRIQFRDRKDFVARSGKLQAFDVLLRKLIREDRSRVIVLVEEIETLEMLDEYLSYKKYSHTCLDERILLRDSFLIGDVFLVSKMTMMSLPCPCLDVNVIINFDINSFEEVDAIGKFCSGVSDDDIQIYRFISTDKRIKAAERVLCKIRSIASVSTTTRVSEIWSDLSELLI